MTLLIVPRRDHLRLLTFLHPHAPNLRVEVQVDFVLKDCDFIGEGSSEGVGLPGISQRVQDQPDQRPDGVDARPVPTCAAPGESFPR